MASYPVQAPVRRTHWLACAAAAAVLAATPALAQPSRTFDIPAQPASEAIREFARASGLQVFAPAEDLAGLRTNPVRGDYAALQALREMVAGAGLEVIQTGPNTVTLRRERRADLEPSTLDEVVVTGSRIARAGFDTLQAATVVGSAQIERRGYANVLEALQDTPGFGAPGNGPVQSSPGNLSVAQSFANFFGLGSQRTLTLVNGRRFVSSNTVSGSGGVGAPGSQVDLNLIPTGLVDRIETVAIGGAPVYGSDAIAGTVNIILKDDYDGLQASAQAGVSDRGDAGSQSYRVLYGRNFADGRGNVVVNAEYSQQDGMVLSERFPFRYLYPSGNTNRTDGIPAQRVLDDLRYAPLTEGGLPFRSGQPAPGTYIVDAAGQPLQFGPNGDLVPFNPGTIAVASSGVPVFALGGDGVDPADHFSLLSPTERYMLNLNGRFDITPDIRAFVEAAYAVSTGEKLSDLDQYAAPGLLGGPALSFSINNPFLSSQARSLLQANGITGAFRMNRNLNDLVDGRPATTELEVYRYVVGLEGGFDVGDERWTWDVALNYGRSRNRSEVNLINPARLQKAIDAVAGSGGPVCAVNANASADDDDPACVALNLFGEGAASQAAIDYVTDRAAALSRNTQSVLTANLAGRLPFGLADKIAFNLGAERREEGGLFAPDNLLQAGNTLVGASGYAGIEGEITTQEFYGEIVAPLVSDAMALPLIRTAQLEGAARYVDHSLSGGDTTWSLGGRVSPRFGAWSEGLTFRGVFTHSIRSPAITELFLGSVGISANPQDVCSAARYNTGPNPAVRAANCAAALAAVGAPAPSAFNPTTSAASAFGTRSGNADLANETADSWSVGFVYQPPSIRGLMVAVDYSSIKLEDAISNLTLPQLLSACYDSPNFPNESACSAFSRLTAAQAAAQPGPTRIAGDIANGFETGFYNTASRDFAGVIGAVEYRFELGALSDAWADAGSLRTGLKVFWVDKDNRVALPGSPTVKYAGVFGTPRWQVSGNLGYSWCRLDLDTQVLWTSATVGDRLATSEDTPVNRFPDALRVDTSLGYAFTENLRAQLAVRNVLDAKTPYAAQVVRAFGPYDPIGRSFSLRLTATF